MFITIVIVIVIIVLTSIIIIIIIATIVIIASFEHLLRGDGTSAPWPSGRARRGPRPPREAAWRASAHVRVQRLPLIISTTKCNKKKYIEKNYDRQDSLQNIAGLELNVEIRIRNMLRAPSSLVHARACVHACVRDE